LSGWQELSHPRAERGPHRRCGTWCRSSLTSRADALYVVNDALGSFLLRANEVIDQVPMSACGANTNVAVTRCCNFQNTLRQSRRNYSGGLELVEGACFEAIDPAPKSIERSLIFSSFATE
jgi:hypothetical protein